MNQPRVPSIPGGVTSDGAWALIRAGGHDLAGHAHQVGALLVDRLERRGPLGDPQGDGLEVVVEGRQQLVHSAS